MRYLKTNTATIVTVGPFYDKTDGVTIEGSLTITNERISLTVDANDGSAPTLVLDNVTGATSGTSNDLNYITGNDAGLMQLELAAANVNYLGRAFLSITDAANHVPVFHEFTILPAVVYDSLIAGSDFLQVDAAQWLGQTIAAVDTNGYPKVTIKDGTGQGEIATTSGAVDSVTTTATATAVTTVNGLAANVITNASIANDALTASKLHSDVTTELQTGLATASALATLAAYVDTEVASILAAVDTEVAAILADTGTDGVVLAPRTVEGSIDEIEALRLILAYVAGKATGGGTSSITFRDTADTKDRIVATVDVDGNRSAVTLDAS